MSQENSVVVIDLIGEVDISTLDDVKRSVMEAVDSQVTVIVNCTDCEFVDSSTLGMFMEAREGVSVHGKHFLLVAPPAGAVRSIVEMARLDSILAVCDSLEQAQARVEGGSL